MRQIIVLRGILVFNLILILSFILGCQTLKKEKLVLPNYEESVKETLQRLKTNYENKDSLAFMQEVSDGYLGGYLELKQRIEDEFLNFDNLDLRIIIDKVLPDKDNIFLETHWYKKRRSAFTLNLEKLKGKTTFLFRILPEGKIKLLGIKQDNPF